MRCVIPQITWNSCQQILSIDFDPSCKGENGFYRLVTVGADTNLLVWHISQPDTLKPVVKCASELNRHQKAVNCVRFSPDGNWIASGDDDAYIIIWRNDRKEPEEENWTVEKSLRKHLGDVTDLSWSADSNYLLSASIDSTAVLWDVKKGASKYIWTEHSGYVHGVTFDPVGKLAASISIDRFLRIYDVTSGKLRTKVNKYVGWVDKTEEVIESAPKPSQEGEEPGGEEAKKQGPPQGNHIFQGDDLATFCRRLCFSPGGEFLMVPAGAVPLEKKVMPCSNNEGDDDSCSSSDPSKKKIKLKPTDKPVASNNAVILFCRNDFSVPCAIIPTDTSYSVACRFNPLYFKRDGNSFEYGSDVVNPVKKDERRIYCTGKVDFNGNECEDAMFDSPARLVYAIATNNSVMIGSTDKLEPLAVVKNIHFARLTDLSWSPDGKVLVTSSTDGYCSLITFEDGELGEKLTEPLATAEPSSFPIPLKEVKVKEPKQKAASVKKEKTPGKKKRAEVEGEEGKTPGRKKRKEVEGEEGKTPGKKKRKEMEGEEGITPGKKAKTKTPKSAARTPGEAGEPKRRTKVKPIKLMLEAQAAAASEKKQGTQTELDSPITVENVENRLPESMMPKLTKMTTEETQNQEEMDTSATEAPKLLPQKNTLDKWIIRKKSDSDFSTPAKSSSDGEAKAAVKSSSATKNGAQEQASMNSTSTKTDDVPMEIEKTSDETADVPIVTETTSSVVSSNGALDKAVALSSDISSKDSESSSSTSAKSSKKPRRVQLITLSSSTAPAEH